MIARVLIVIFAAIALLGATHAAPSKLAALISHHPLYPLLQQYDRQIAALRATESAPGLNQLSSSIDASIRSAQTESARTQQKVNALAANRGGLYQARENAAVARLDASHAFSPGDARARADRELAAYRDQLSRETNAMLAAYRQSIVQRTQRAFAQRQQEMRERESALAFDLQQKNGGEELKLRLKLEYLHLDEESRHALQSQLSTLLGGDAARVASMRRADAATLATYRSQLERTADADDARMTSQLQSKAIANLELRSSILSTEASAQAVALPASLAAQASTFRNNYNFTNDAASIASGLSQTSAGIAQHFAALKNDEVASRAATDAAIASLQADRQALYQAIVHDVTR
jgi:hypothetical protein